MTYGRAIDGEPVSPDARAAVSHGLTSSPPKGRGKTPAVELTSRPAEHAGEDGVDVREVVLEVEQGLGLEGRWTLPESGPAFRRAKQSGSPPVKSCQTPMAWTCRMAAAYSGVLPFPDIAVR